MALNKANLFYQLADSLEGKAKKKRLGLTAIGSEHPSEMLVSAASDATKSLQNAEIVVFGPERALIDFDNIEKVPVKSLEEAHRKMEEMLDKGQLDAAVTMHFNFPIGISTIGRVITPSRGKPMFIATTTGTTATDRVCSMVKNAISGIIAAKASGIKNPTIGILNLDGARQTERILKQLAKKGYDINFAKTLRADGGCIMRGNDLLAGSCDIMVTDTLTGNLLMKIFSAYTTGGNYEALGWGYGPGIGENMKNIVLILSRASGAPVVKGALEYAAEMVCGDLLEVAREEYDKLNKLGFNDILKSELKHDLSDSSVKDKIIKCPPKKVVTQEIAGIDVLQMEDGVKALWQSGIYAESGMGCTGPVILVASEDQDKAIKILKSEGYLI